MNTDLSRRSFLEYVGAGASAAILGPLVGCSHSAADGQRMAGAPGWVINGAPNKWTPVPYPIPAPGDGGIAATDAKRLAAFTVQDDLLLPPGFRYRVVAEYGQPIGSGKNRFPFGFAADYTGLIPVAGAADEFFLIVNHEYISGRPWLQGFSMLHGQSPVDERGRIAGVPLIGCALDLLDPNFIKNGKPELINGLRKMCAAAMSDLGLSVLHVKRTPDGGFAVLADSDKNFRITGHSAVNTTAPVTFTGPAAELLGPTAPGTFSNCSGATTPWGTFLTCEENFQDQVPEYITADGKPLPGGKKRLAGLGEDHPTNLPFEFEGLGTGLEPPLDGRQFGWVCEVNPVKRTLRKLTSLGRFRHENVAVRAEPGKRLAAYLGDDRRGGHLWKFLSDSVIADPTSAATGQLLSKGTLYVARLEPDFTGRWIPLTPTTPLRLPEVAQTAMGNMWLPDRPKGGQALVGTDDYLERDESLDEWIKDVEAFAGKKLADMTLADLVRGDNPLAVILTDAYVMANCVGGTPCARPEDVEVHPKDQSIYIAFTDSTGSLDGSPDKRIFPDSAGKNSRQYGAIYRIAEDNNDPAALTFTWGKFCSSGETADGGGAFACADNLWFDADANPNLWMVCDITTPSHNAAVDRAAKSPVGSKTFPGIFGNNAMFMIPTTGPNKGQPHCFAIGPMESELTGPTWAPDGRSLLIAVQHPGELNGIRGTSNPKLPAEEKRKMNLAARDGKVFVQDRTVPLGSNFPSGKPGQLPKPCVVCITRDA